jgi:hypothetical protein
LISTAIFTLIPKAAELTIADTRSKQMAKKFCKKLGWMIKYMCSYEGSSKVKKEKSHDPPRRNNSNGEDDPAKDTPAGHSKDGFRGRYAVELEANEVRRNSPRELCEGPAARGTPEGNKVNLGGCSLGGTPAQADSGEAPVMVCRVTGPVPTWLEDDWCVTEPANI